MTTQTTTDSEARRELDRQRRRMALVFEYIRGYCIVMLDDAGMMIEWNPSIGRLFGVAADAIVGQPLLSRVSLHLEESTPPPDFSSVSKVIAKAGWCRVDAS